jgi:hypothetical protein
MVPATTSALAFARALAMAVLGSVGSGYSIRYRRESRALYRAMMRLHDPNAPLRQSCLALQLDKRTFETVLPNIHERMCAQLTEQQQSQQQRHCIFGVLGHWDIAAKDRQGPSQSQPLPNPRHPLPCPRNITASLRLRFLVEVRGVRLGSSKLPWHVEPE